MFVQASARPVSIDTASKKDITLEESRQEGSLKLHPADGLLENSGQKQQSNQSSSNVVIDGPPPVTSSSTTRQSVDTLMRASSSTSVFGGLPRVESSSAQSTQVRVPSWCIMPPTIEAR
jgi:hypothetical protein